LASTLPGPPAKPLKSSGPSKRLPAKPPAKPPKKILPPKPPQKTSPNPIPQIVPTPAPVPEVISPEPGPRPGRISLLPGETLVFQEYFSGFVKVKKGLIIRIEVLSFTNHRLLLSFVCGQEEGEEQ
jgi:hypothetical protein